MSSESVAKARDKVCNYKGPKIKIMEVCGTHTHEIFRLGIRNLLPEGIELISGPGCPVCVSPIGYIDEALMLALDKGATVFTFGDLMRVPGSEMSLAEARGKGAKIEIVYSPLDALEYAKRHLDEEVVFLAIGFETTTPGSAIAVRNAAAEGIENFSILTSNKTMHNAYPALEGSADVFLYPGHVSTMTGMQVYRDLAERGISGVVAGFTASEIITALAVAVSEVEKLRASGGAIKGFAENCYPSVVTEEGSPAARALVAEMMEPCDSEWRGLGVIADSGVQLKAEYAAYDARRKFELPPVTGRANPACRCGEVLLGVCKPNECKVYGKACTPEHPIGACMVSNEGACSAFYKYSKKEF